MIENLICGFLTIFGVVGVIVGVVSGINKAIMKVDQNLYTPEEIELLKRKSESKFTETNQRASIFQRLER